MTTKQETIIVTGASRGIEPYIPEPRDKSALQGIRVNVMALLKAKLTLDARLV